MKTQGKTIATRIGSQPPPNPLLRKEGELALDVGSIDPILPPYEGGSQRGVGKPPWKSYIRARDEATALRIRHALDRNASQSETIL